MTFLPSNSKSFYLQTSVVLPEDQQQLIITLTDLYTQNALATNLKEIGVYELDEFQNGEQYFNSTTPSDKRFGYRKMFSIGAIAAGATLTFAHNITEFTTLTFTDAFAQVVVNAGTFNQRRVPYVDAVTHTNGIQIDYDSTNVRIINGATAPDIVSGIVELNYLKV